MVKLNITLPACNFEVPGTCNYSEDLVQHMKAVKKKRLKIVNSTTTG